MPHPPQGGQPGQWGQQGQPFGGAPNQWGGGQPQYAMPPTPPKSKRRLWLAIAGGVVAVAIIVVLLFLLLGGGKYAGKTRPELPNEFGGWTQGESFFGMYAYSKDGAEITVIEFDAPTDGEIDEADDLDVFDDMPDVDVTETSPANGVHCVTATEYGGTSCAIVYEDRGGFFLGGDVSQAAVEDAAVALAKAG